MARMPWLHPLAVVLLLASPVMEARAQTPPAPRVAPLALWKTLHGDEKPTTIQGLRAGSSLLSPMVIVKRSGTVITEGDIAVGAQGQTRTDSSTTGAVVRNAAVKWPKVNGKVLVPYTVDPSLPAATKQAVQAAAREIEQKTQGCVRFVPRTREADYIQVTDGAGCYSYIGVQRGPQKLSLGQGCGHTGTAAHEFMHSLGFYHEHNRPDRDAHLTIDFGNVEQGQEGQFEKCRDCATQDLPYDYESIMHFGGQAFTKEGRDTLVPKQKGAKLVEPYEKTGLSSVDTYKVRKMYNCAQ